MASRKHNGLGRGLDALFPIQEDNSIEKDNTGEVEADTYNASDTVDAHHDTEKPHHDVNQSHQIVMARLSRIEPNRLQPRKKFDEKALEELAQSIKDHGLLQPILVQDRGTHYEIIAGERRWRASRIAGLHEVPVIVRNYSDQEITELSLIENLQREDLNAIEEAKAYRLLIIKYDMTQDELAKRLSKSRTAIANTMRLLKLDVRVQDMVADGRISMGQARALIPLGATKEQTELAAKIAEENMSVREVEKTVKRIRMKRNASGSTSNTAKKQNEAAQREKERLFYNDLENQLKESLHTKVAIQPGKNGAGKLEIEFYNSGDLEQIMDLLIGHEI